VIRSCVDRKKTPSYNFANLGCANNHHCLTKKVRFYPTKVKGV